MVELSKIYIPATLECNLSCKYCPQTFNHYSTPELTDGVREYLYNLNSSQCQNVTITGGEPLLAWDKTVEIFSYVSENIDKRIITNGLLLTQDIVNYVNSNNIEIQLGYDGPSTEFLRGVDILQSSELMNLIKQIKKLKISSVITRYNNDVWENFFYIANKLNHNKFSYIATPIGDNGQIFLQDMIKDFDYDLAIRTWYEFRFSRYCLNQSTENIKNHTDAENTKINSLSFTIMPNGDIYNLSNNIKLGTIYEDSFTDFINRYKETDYFKPCLECPIFLKCRNTMQYMSNHLCKLHQSVMKFRQIFINKDAKKFETYINNKLPDIEKQYEYTKQI